MATAAEAETRADAFREGVRAWLKENFPSSLAGKEGLMTQIEVSGGDREAFESWRKAMGEKGWGTPTWPAEYGGGGLSREEAKILQQEMAKIGAWNPIGGMGVMMFGPTLLEYGNEAQKQEHIPAICKAEVRWCQGYSEPGAGSDLASLQTFAEDKGDHYLVNGQKTWTSGGQWADKCFALVRTDKSKKHEGISFLLIDMNSPGVETRPIRLISGASPFCETFFTDVKVPKENLVGEEGQGWTIGKRLLQHERTNISGARGAGGPTLAELAKRYVGEDDAGRIADADLRTRIANFDIRWRAFMQTTERVRQQAKDAGGVSVTSSILKNIGTKLSQERLELMLEIMGMQGLGWEGDGFDERELQTTRQWLSSKAFTIYGGSAEIQNNIIAKRVLGMLDHQ